MNVKIPTSKTGQFWFYFVVQFLLYGLIVANTRAYTQGFYAWTAGTDGLIALLNFTAVRAISKQEESQSSWGTTGYVVGGMLGSLAFMWITIHLYGR